MATQASIVAELRNLLYDTVTPNLWSDSELTEYANKAIREFVVKTECIEDYTTTAATQITISAGTATYTLHSSVIRITRAVFDNTTNPPLDIRPVHFMDENYPSWEYDTTRSTPTVLIHNGYGDTRVRLYKIPVASGTLYLTIKRMPITELIITTPAGTPDIPARFHDAIIPGAMHWALLKNDSQTYDQERAKTYLTLFDREIEFAKRSMLNYRYGPSYSMPSGGLL